MKKMILLIAVIVGLGALFVLLKPRTETAQQGQSSHAENEPKTRTFTVTIRNAELVAGEKTMSVNQGDEVQMTVTSDVADELHLHGYDKEIELDAGKPTTLSFTANLTGRFDAELHHADKTVFVLEVQPK